MANNLIRCIEREQVDRISRGLTPYQHMPESHDGKVVVYYGYEGCFRNDIEFFIKISQAIKKEHPESEKSHQIVRHIEEQRGHHHKHVGLYMVGVFVDLECVKSNQRLYQVL